MNLKNFSLDLKNKKRLIPQFLTLLFIVLGISYFAFNAQVNMENRGIAFGFGFLTQEASFDIGFSLIEYDGSDSYARAFLVGLLNTLLVSTRYSISNINWRNSWYRQALFKLLSSKILRSLC